jgi:hypothetical protein
LASGLEVFQVDAYSPWLEFLAYEQPANHVLAYQVLLGAYDYQNLGLSMERQLSSASTVPEEPDDEPQDATPSFE